jgi:hypothetical protein
MPKATKFHFDQAATLKNENRWICQMAGSDMFAVASKNVGQEYSNDDLTDIFNKILKSNYESWEDFVKCKNLVYIVRPSTINPAYFICSCKVGIKKKICKHNLYIMHYVVKSIVNPYLQNTPLTPRRKRGRPSLAKNALKFDKI